MIKQRADNRIYFENLDVLRFFAAMLIVVAHGFEAWKTDYLVFRMSPAEADVFFTPAFKRLELFFSSFGIGVEIFFFISGFLITYILLKERELCGNISIWKFYVRRALRIWPLYFLLIALGPFLTYWMNIGNPNYAANLLFVGNFETIATNEWQYPFAHYWTIAIEEQFYFLWPVVLAFVPLKRLKLVFIFLIAVSVLSRAAYYLYGDEVWMNLQLNTLCRMDTLVIGSLIALYYWEGNLKFRLPKYTSVILFSILFISFIFEPYSDWNSLTSALFKKYFYLVIIAAACVNWILNSQANTNSVVYKTFTYLGKISYGIYLIHNVLVIVVIKRILLNNEIDSSVVFFIVYPLSVILLSIVSFELIEKPFLRLKDKFANVKTRKY
jgi:peptidoglycan/LPS O-acetylase OafA/YrhL